MRITTSINEKALFLGNGINRTSESGNISWGQLLRRVAGNYEIIADLDNPLKPFPLAFEEMFQLKDGSNTPESKIRNLKTEISRIVNTEAPILIDPQIHTALMNCGIKEIITTNYDYNLEISADESFIENKKSLALNNLESRHSLYRGYSINGVRVRHIHGELAYNRLISDPEKNYKEESVMIGFNHYTDYLEVIQNAFKGEKGKQKESEKKSQLIRLRDNDTGKIWTDLFFTHDVIFAGFSMDFSEQHLWWLLMQRDILKKSNNQNIDINNEIIFYYPSLQNNGHENDAFNEKYIRKLNEDKNRGAADVLKSIGVKYFPISCNSYKDFYLRLIDNYLS